MTTLSKRHTWRFYTPIVAIGENRQVCPVERLRFSPIADIWHVRYRRLNSPAFAECARSRDFLRSLLRIARKANPLGWAILSHEFSKLPHRRDRRKKSPGVSASYRWRKLQAIFAGDQIRRDRRIKSPGVSLALERVPLNYERIVLYNHLNYSLNLLTL